jgi:ATP-dependent Clp protease ATP-binding subunit ClpA
MEVNTEARLWLSEQGYDKAMGARPMSRVIREQLRKPLANEILFGRLNDGGHVDVGIKDGKLDFQYEDEVAEV